MKALPVFYTEEMVADAESFSPSAGKPREVMRSWRQLKVPLTVHAPAPLTREQFATAHEREYVDDVLDLKSDNGFGNRLASVAASLPFTSGAMFAAAADAVRNGQVAVAPCSGFHHAGWDGPQGYCTFNGLVIAACLLRAQGVTGDIGILDFDQHYGNGTAEIMRKRRLGWIRHFTAGAHYERPSQAGEFLASIPRLVERMGECAVILYQAGADPHVDDPLGGWLTTEQLRERDRRVFEAARRVGVPVAWNLAGGYQTPLRCVLDIHDHTLIECARVYLEDGWDGGERGD